ncbi:hypothetical protein P8452_42599 [Trifolium repens]|nr:hypothetical protein P8452_42599 [Trifolium repens]
MKEKEETNKQRGNETVSASLETVRNLRLRRLTRNCTPPVFAALFFRASHSVKHPRRFHSFVFKSLSELRIINDHRWGTRILRMKLQKVTCPEPFKLRTDQRGKVKEKVFEQKVQQMKTEEENQRILVAQGLPWTIDEPECWAKSPVKEITIPVDLKLHTDVRALGRAEFDEQLTEKLLFIEDAEEEIKRSRKELIPKAKRMSYFDAISMLG